MEIANLAALMVFPLENTAAPARQQPAHEQGMAASDELPSFALGPSALVRADVWRWLGLGASTRTLGGLSRNAAIERRYGLVYPGAIVAGVVIGDDSFGDVGIERLRRGRVGRLFPA